MRDILLTIYLAVLLVFTFWRIVDSIKVDNRHTRLHAIIEILLALNWSIWYIYILH